MCLPVAVYHEPGPYRPPLKPSEKLAASFPYLCFVLVVMGMSSAIYHESHHPMSDEVIVEDLSYYQTGPYQPLDMSKVTGVALSLQAQAAVAAANTLGVDPQAAYVYDVTTGEIGTWGPDGKLTFQKAFGVNNG